jgi:hypothetical protein
VRFRMRRFGGLSLSRPKNEADLSNQLVVPLRITIHCFITRNTVFGIVMHGRAKQYPGKSHVNN